MQDDHARHDQKGFSCFTNFRWRQRVYRRVAGAQTHGAFVNQSPYASAANQIAANQQHPVDDFPVKTGKPAIRNQHRQEQQADATGNGKETEDNPQAIFRRY